MNSPSTYRLSPSLDGIRIAAIGLRYVGLTMAAALGRHFPTVGFDIDAQRVSDLERHHDHTLEMSQDELRDATHLAFSCDPSALVGCNVFIVTVPTPIDEYRRPDLHPLESASRTVGRAIRRDGLVTRPARRCSTSSAHCRVPASTAVCSPATMRSAISASARAHRLPPRGAGAPGVDDPGSRRHGIAPPRPRTAIRPAARRHRSRGSTGPPWPGARQHRVARNTRSSTSETRGHP